MGTLGTPWQDQSPHTKAEPPPPPTKDLLGRKGHPTAPPRTLRALFPAPLPTLGGWVAPVPTSFLESPASSSASEADADARGSVSISSSAAGTQVSVCGVSVLLPPQPGTPMGAGWAYPKAPAQ